LTHSGHRAIVKITLSGRAEDIKLNGEFRCGVSRPRYRCFGDEYRMNRRLETKPMPVTFGSRLRSREIKDSDVDTLAKFLGTGLGYRSQYFSQILNRLAEHPTPAGFPRFGYVLEKEERIVGAILLIFSTIWSDDAPTVRCHVTSWCVEPEFRPYAALFFSKALRHNNVTYLNTSARPDTRPIIKAQGFLQYVEGQFIAFPVLNFWLQPKDNRVEIVPGDKAPNARFEPYELDLLKAHAKYGCICLWCDTPERAYPFVFHQRLFKGFLPGLQLVFCRDIQDFVRFALPLGLFLAARGKLAVRIDSNGQIPGLIGKYIDGMEPRYYKGPKPRLGDLSYTQTVMCPYPRRDSHTVASPK
jgi:hypothetical protein